MNIRNQLSNQPNTGFIHKGHLLQRFFHKCGMNMKSGNVKIPIGFSNLQRFPIQLPQRGKSVVFIVWHCGNNRTTDACNSRTLQIRLHFLHRQPQKVLIHTDIFLLCEVWMGVKIDYPHITPPSASSYVHFRNSIAKA